VWAFCPHRKLKSFNQYEFGSISYTFREPTTEDHLSLPKQSQEPKIFVKDITVDNEISGRTERYSKYRYERRWSAEEIV